MADVVRTGRSDWIDAAKGIGIVLVVYGHLLSSAVRAGVAIPQQFFNVSDSVLYSFHMPLFFFLAGLLAEHSYSRRGARSFIADKFTYLAYPYLVWSILQVGVECFVTRNSEHPVAIADLLLVPIRPHEQFWFLYALFWCYASYALSRQSVQWGRPLLVLAAVALFWYPIRTEFLALYDFSMQLIFFVSGVCVSSRLLKTVRGSHDVLWTMLRASSFLICALSAFLWFVPPMRLTEDYGAYPLLLLGLAAFGIAATVGVTRISAATKFGRAASAIGRYSMPIFLAHMLVGVPARILLTKSGMENPWLVLTASVMLAVLVPILIYRAASAKGFHLLFAWTSARSSAV